MEIDTRETAPLAAPPQTPPTTCEIIDPLTGEVIDREDNDALISAYERVNRTYNKLKAVRVQLAIAMAERTVPGEKRTRRLAGHLRLAKIEMPGDYFAQDLLKEAWNSYPHLRDQYLRIAQIDPKLTEVKKLWETSGEPDLESFKRILAQARQPSTATPTITIER